MVVTCAVGVALSASSGAQTAVTCSFLDGFWSGSRIVITPATAATGDTVEVSWVAANDAQRQAHDRFETDPTWSVGLGATPLAEGPPPHTIGGYRWDNLVIPDDARLGSEILTLDHGDAQVWECPITI